MRLSDLLDWLLGTIDEPVEEEVTDCFSAADDPTLRNDLQELPHEPREDHHE
jgi:hypothetical protein